MRQSLQASYILHSRPYRNTSKLLDIFSREQGRRVLVARGARKEKSRLQGHLQPFVPLLLSWQGGGEVQTLTGAEPAEQVGVINSRQLLTAFYLNELLLRLLAKADPHPALYDAYAATLQNLSEISSQEEVHLRMFECFLLQELGYGLVLDHDVASGEVLQAEQRYCYQPEYGPVKMADHSCESGLPIQGATLLALHQADLKLHQTDADRTIQILREAKQLLRMSLAHHLGNRPLKSRELYRQQKQLLKP